MKKDFVIVGAGKLGRGYLADIFKEGYHLIFLETYEPLVKSLREQGSYTHFKSREEGGYDRYVYRDFEIYCTLTEEDKCIEVLARTDIGGIATYKDGFAPFGKLLAKAVKKRLEEGNKDPLDILILANSVSPDKVIREAMNEELTCEEKAFADEKIGLVQTLPFRGGYPPSEEMLKEDPLAVSTTDYPEIPVDEAAFRGEIPSDVPLLLLDKMTERLNAKIWTANIRGAIMAALGKQKGYTYIEEVNADEDILRQVAIGIDEAVTGALDHFGFTKEQFEKGRHKTILKGSRTTSDVLDRQLNNLKRKLGRNERMTGPAVACLKTGRIPFYITKAEALAFDYVSDTDPEAEEVRTFVKEKGIRDAVKHYCGLDESDIYERQIIDLIEAHYIDNVGRVKR